MHGNSCCPTKNITGFLELRVNQAKNVTRYCGVGLPDEKYYQTLKLRLLDKNIVGKYIHVDGEHTRKVINLFETSFMDKDGARSWLDPQQHYLVPKMITQFSSIQIDPCSEDVYAAGVLAWRIFSD
ncbi:hypothetical protein RCL_jg27193.t1 [Rhizophagus clarus]|uniref:Uncharacterized protein n=1 Tax=Rhizophagus clarus TaxID=94130 RepID=A0A8H3QW73_9GLOM|nr:hypothetical protein RCL_jg27193.t1 [Rhizophagus clarus]